MYLMIIIMRICNLERIQNKVTNNCILYSVVCSSSQIASSVKLKVFDPANYLFSTPLPKKKIEAKKTHTKANNNSMLIFFFKSIRNCIDRKNYKVVVT